MDHAINLVLYSFENAAPGEIFVRKAPASTIGNLAKAITELMGVPNHEIQIIGIRHGEKACEALLSREEMATAEDLGDYYRILPDLRDLNYGKFVEEGEFKISESVEYTSENTTHLDIEGMKALLMKLPFMQAAINGKRNLSEV